MSGSVDSEHPYVTGCRPAGFLQKPMKLDDVRAALDALEGLESEEVSAPADDDLVALSMVARAISSEAADGADRLDRLDLSDCA
jgi:hypothetical protein